MFQFTANNDDYMPQLLPLEKKITPETSKTPIKTHDNLSAEKTSAAPLKSAVPDTGLSLNRQLTMSFKNQEIQRLANNRMNEQYRIKKQADLKKKNELSKNLIQEMTNKITAKHVTEDLYPVSNETINRLIRDIDEEVQLLMIEVQKRQNSLTMNPNNQHLKKELQGFEKNLNQVKTIKDLYGEKIESRNKISELEGRIIDLKFENRDLKIKIARGIEKIESHIHNLPCEKEKQLIEEVNKYKLELSIQKEMRQNLEQNISNIVLNFKRFYVEADNARQIVSEKLKAVETKEIQLNAKIQRFNLNVKEKQQNSTGEKSIIFKSQKNTDLRDDKRSNDYENSPEYINTSFKKTKDSGFRDEKNKPSGYMKKYSDEIKAPFSLEEQINKMRGNQLLFSKTPPKRI